MLTVAGVSWAVPGEFVARYDLVAAAGSCLAVSGPSGGGKSTLLDLIAGFLKPRAGTIHFAGQRLEDLPPERRPVSLLFQDHNLFPHLDALTNVGLGLSGGLRLSVVQRRAALDALARVGLATFGDRLPGALSGGQQQRVALARALLRDRPLLLLDEPFSALDPPRRREMLTLIDAVRCERRLTVLMVTHAVEDALAIADAAAVIENGRVTWTGAPAALPVG